jgi:uncharacterized protein Yka (UPF0111/DUF47 family)
MLIRFLPGNQRFFKLFSQHAELGVQGCRELLLLLTHLSTERELRAQNVEVAEKAADRITRQTIELLKRTPVAPLHPDAIHKLISVMDDVLDLAEDTAQTIYLYDIKRVTPAAIQLAEICVACAERLEEAVSLLVSRRNRDGILRLCEQIDKLESDADHVMRAAMSRLFRDEPDTRELIKLKAVYELLEQITDKTEDVANIIEGLVLERSWRG